MIKFCSLKKPWACVRISVEPGAGNRGIIYVEYIEIKTCFLKKIDTQVLGVCKYNIHMSIDRCQ